MGTTRAFIAFRVSDEVKDELFRIQQELKKINPRARVKWSETSDAHVTIVFMGEITTDLVTQISLILKQIAERHKPFDLQFQNVDAFPNRLAPKTIVVKVEDGEGEGGKIRAELAKELRGLDLEIACPLGLARSAFVRGARLPCRHCGQEADGGRARHGRREDKKFNPHLTLGRNKFGDKIVGLDKINVEKIFWQVESVELIKSDLFPSGPQYTILQSFSLKNHG